MPHSECAPLPPDYRAYLAAFDRARRLYQQDPTRRHLAVVLAGRDVLYRELGKSGKFDLGAQVATPGAIDAIRVAGNIPPEFLLRHKHGYSGELDEEDRHANDHALLHGTRLFSAYRTRRHDNIWVITEWDRSVTTLLLPEEY